MSMPYVPVGGFQDALGQVVADEAVDAEDEDFFHMLFSSECSVAAGLSGCQTGLQLLGRDGHAIGRQSENGQHAAIAADAKTQLSTTVKPSGKLRAATLSVAIL
jgi:hypothetical protein